MLIPPRRLGRLGTRRVGVIVAVVSGAAMGLARPDVTAASTGRPSQAVPDSARQQRPARTDTTSPRQQRPATARDTTPTGHPAFTLSGRVWGMHGRPQPDVVVALSALSEAGDILWSAASTSNAVRPNATDSIGRYSIPYPGALGREPARFRLSITRQRVVSDTFHLALPWKFDVAWPLRRLVEPDTLSWKASTLRSASATITLDLQLRYDPAPPIYTAWLFAPAIVGLMAAVLAFAFSGRARAQDKRKHNQEPNAAHVDLHKGGHEERRTESRQRRVLFWYACVGTLMWVAVVIRFVVGYVSSGLRSISLLDPGLSVTVLVPVAAFLGVLVYATECLVKHHNAYEERLIALGNRVFIAPYVSLIAILALFQGKTDGLLPPFVAFITGFWIEPVLEALRVVGKKLIPASAKDDDGGKPDGSPAEPPEAPKATDTLKPGNELQRGRRTSDRGTVRTEEQTSGQKPADSLKGRENGEARAQDASEELSKDNA